MPPTQAALEAALGSLRAPYHISDAVVSEFETRRYVRLAGVLPPLALEEARRRLNALASRATGGRNVSLPTSAPPETNGTAAENAARWAAVSEPTTRSWHIQMMWAVDPVVRALVLSPRVGGIVARLLGCDNVRLYHDNVLSRAPGSKRTRWHCDDGPNGYMAVRGPQVVTVWIPLLKCPPSMGSLVFPRDPSASVERSLDSYDVAAMDGAAGLEEQSDEYDRFCSEALREVRVRSLPPTACAVGVALLQSSESAPRVLRPDGSRRATPRAAH